MESQTKEDETRRRRWPYYIAFVRDKYDCQVVMLVVTSKKATAEWARVPIEVGEPGAICMVVAPLVLGPDNVPPVTTVGEAAADLPFAVFSALTHSREGETNVILETLAAALDSIDVDTAADLAEFTEIGLGMTPGLGKWRMLMVTETFAYVSELRSKGREEGRQEGLQEGRQEGRQEGLAEGEAKAVLLVLKQRKIKVDDVSRERIESCTDLKQLETWLENSVTVAKAEDLFKD